MLSVAACVSCLFVCVVLSRLVARVGFRCVVLVSALLLGTAQSAVGAIGGCAIFPPNNVWNTPVDTLGVDAGSASYIAAEGGGAAALHQNFGTVWQGAPVGIPYVVVPATQTLVPIVLTPYGAEGDPGPYPIPPGAPVEGGPASNGDRHLLVLQQGNCVLYELYRAFPLANGGWQGFGAKFNLKANAPLRPAQYTSADAAGLPIFPGLVKYEEVAAALQAGGMIGHALRFTVPNIRRAYVWPARHYAGSSTNTNYPPMGQRFRLKATVDIDYYPGTNPPVPVSPTNKVILRSLKKYGMLVADHGGSFSVSGAPDPRWNDEDLHNLAYYRATDFEAVNSSALMLDPNSGQAAAPPACTTLPARPTLLKPLIGARAGAARVTLDWDDTSCATFYNLTVRKDTSSGAVMDSPTQLSASRYVTVSLANTGPYVWRVEACNSLGCVASSWGKFVR
jgi:hypothetical protein